ncbi:metalloregulator ArsR/SmtB family transcription factor [Leifsonia sp. NCR5]|uniref:metalloregulator ArsR/SmtB family transcription factor n=1 Tax=Leifsonia sp. NCR5 TaxID=1978342 RepID=UPI000A18CA42|nr:metalloregulator ArsR/SmtB family transcription factor [Leifsonia sp. NCR5]
MSVANAPGLQSLKRISDPTRAALLRIILDSEEGRGSVTRMAEALGLTQPTVSHHLRMLKNEGLVEREQAGRTAWYSITPSQLDRVSDLVSDGQATDDTAALQRIVADLTTRYRGVLAPETVREFVEDSYQILGERDGSHPNRASQTSSFTIDRLDAILRASESSHAVPEVLFVCVQNAGRSQLASAILRQLAGDRVIVRTAGSEPADAVRSTIVTVLDEIGMPLGGEFPKPLTDEAVRAADYVITMGCGDACPVFPGREYLDWDVPDPVGQPVVRVREIRDDIERRVRGLLEQLEGERVEN